MKKHIFASALFVGMLAFGADVAAIEDRLRADILAQVNAVNPIDPVTGARKHISFGFITDIHKCKRVEGDDAAANPVTTYWYGSAGCLTEAEPSIRLLGSVAQAAGLDAVINGGDFSTAPITGKRGLTKDEYLNEIMNVKGMFDRHLPAGLPLFTVDGNHDRKYTANGANIQMSDAEWALVLTNFNTSAAVAQAHGINVTYHRDLPKGAGNTYHLDFHRLVATKGSNVRICCLSQYDTDLGSDVKHRVVDAVSFDDARGANTIMGLVSHGGGAAPYGDAGLLEHMFLNGPSRGRGFFGLVCGHAHFTQDQKQIVDAFSKAANPGNEVYASMIRVASAYAVNRPSKPKEHQLGTEHAYHFSIFIVDTDANLLREVRVGGWRPSPIKYEDPVVQLHATSIRRRF